MPGKGRPITERERAASEDALRWQLIDQPLTSMWRIAGMQILEFGIQKPFINAKGEETTKADGSFHVSCEWGIFGPDFRLTSNHFGEVRTDEFALDFYGRVSNNPLIVLNLNLDLLGNLDILLTDGFRICFVPDDDDGDQWRFLAPETGADVVMDN